MADGDFCKHKHGDLMVWWIPQVPMGAFRVSVATLVEARLLLQTLASYDEFQWKNQIKPDYCNAGGLLVFDAEDKTDSINGSWTDWHSEDGEDIDGYNLEGLRETTPVWEGDI